MLNPPSAQRHPNEPARALAAHVHMVAAQQEDACELMNALQQLLGEDSGFALRASGLQQLQEAPLTPGDAVLLLMPQLPASNACTGQHQAHAAMSALRDTLVASGAPFQVLYGNTSGQFDGALIALCSWHPEVPALQEQRKALQAHGNLQRWKWSCEKCSDPECELRLFKGLLNNTTAD